MANKNKKSGFFGKTAFRRDKWTIVEPVFE
jgi:hypothetical protein